MQPVKEMSLMEYQTHALSTALPTAFSAGYLVPGIISEVGEIYGKFAKAYRDRWGMTKPAGYLAEELAKEYGDVCWGTAMLLHMQGIDTIPESIAERAPQFLDEYATCISPDIALGVILRNAMYLGTFTSLAEDDAALVLWERLRMFAPVITGKSFDYILGMNVVKLADRKARNVLEGSGDER